MQVCPSAGMPRRACASFDEERSERARVGLVRGKSVAPTMLERLST